MKERFLTRRALGVTLKFDIFLSLCQTEVEGYLPSEKTMFKNFFDQVILADHLGFETAWVAETHLSCEIQKNGSNAVIPHFKGEIGLNTDILQMAHKIFSMTDKINVGSAIRNILCNGGPVAHAEAIKTFLTLHQYTDHRNRHLNIGFASGRFDFSNRPYGIFPRNKTEKTAWSALKGKILIEATEIFLRLLKSEEISSADIAPKILNASNFKTPEDWKKTKEAYSREAHIEESQIESIEVPPFWNFDKLGIIPKDTPLDLLRLTLGSQDSNLQIFANQFLPVSVFNLSITPEKIVEQTHERMFQHYKGNWSRDKMPRTTMIFLDEKSEKAKDRAIKAWENYWRAMEGTIDVNKVEKAVANALWGRPEEIFQKIKEKYQPGDRLMCWFDFNNHDNDFIKKSMRVFMKEVARELQ